MVRINTLSFIFVLLLASLQLFTDTVVVYPIVASYIIIVIGGLALSYKLFEQQKSALNKVMIVLFFLFSIAYIHTQMSGDTLYLERVDIMYKVLSQNFALYFIFSFLSERIHVNYRIMFWYLLCLGCYYYFYSTNVFQISESVVNNYAYFLSAVCPLVAFERRLIFRLLGIICVLVITAISLKRGAFLIAGLSSVILVTFEQNTKLKIKIILICLFLVLLVTDLNISSFFDNEALINRAELTMDGYMSNRDVIYMSIINGIKNFDVFTMLFGNGLGYSMSLTGGLMAHNDILEIYVDMGVAGIITLVYFVFLLLRSAYTSYKLKEIIWQRFIALILVFVLIKGMFSMVFTDTHSWPLFLLIALVEIHQKNKYISS